MADPRNALVLGVVPQLRSASRAHRRATGCRQKTSTDSHIPLTLSTLHTAFSPGRFSPASDVGRRSVLRRTVRSRWRHSRRHTPRRNAARSPDRTAADDDLLITTRCVRGPRTHRHADDRSETDTCVRALEQETRRDRPRRLAAAALAAAARAAAARAISARAGPARVRPARASPARAASARAASA